MKKAMAIICILSCACCISCKKSRIDWHKELKLINPETALLHGRIKSLHSFYYKADEKFGKVIKVERIPAYKLDNGIPEQQVFDKNRNIIESICFESDSSIRTKITYKYNENNHITERNVFDSSGTLLRKNSYIYNENECLVEELTINNKNEIEVKNTFIYDARGDFVEGNSYNSDGKISGKTKSKYDDDNNSLEIIKYNPDGKPKDKNIFKYNSKGSFIEEDSFNKAGILLVKTFWQYDKNERVIESFDYKGESSVKLSRMTSLYDDSGNIIEKCDYMDDGSLFYKVEFKYIYDKNNNWISKIQYYNGVPTLFAEREIEYY